MTRLPRPALNALLLLSCLSLLAPLAEGLPSAGIYCGGKLHHTSSYAPYKCVGKTIQWFWGGTSVTICVGTYYYATGSYDAYCEWDWQYAISVESGQALLLCEGTSCTSTGVVGPKTYCEPPAEWREHPYAPVAALSDGNLEDCNGDGVPAEYDGHAEYAANGAYLKAAGAAPGCEDDGEMPHHPLAGPVTVRDGALGLGAEFSVWADTVDLTGVQPCGDGLVDEETTCLGTCEVPFPPGLDGYYAVSVRGTTGVVSTP